MEIILWVGSLLLVEAAVVLTVATWKLREIKRNV